MAVISTGLQNALNHSVSNLIYDNFQIFTKFIFDSDDIQEENGTIKITFYFQGLDLKKFPIPVMNIKLTNIDTNQVYTINSFQSLFLDIKIPTGDYKLNVVVFDIDGEIKETKEEYIYYKGILNTSSINEEIIKSIYFDNYLYKLCEKNIIKIAYNKEILTEEDLIENIYYYNNTTLGIPVRCFKFAHFDFDSTKNPICAKLIDNQCDGSDLILAESNYYFLIDDILNLIIHLKNLHINNEEYRFIMNNPINKYSSLVIQIK